MKRLIGFFFIFSIISFTQTNSATLPKTAPQPSAPAKKVATTPKTQPKPAPNPSELTVDEIVQLVQIGLSDDVIIAKIRQNNKPLDLTVNDFIKLKTGKVSENVIMVLINPAAEIKTVPPPPVVEPLPEPVITPTPVETEKIMMPKPPETIPAIETGIYLAEDGINGKLIKLTKTTLASGAKAGTVSSVGLVLTYGIHKTKQKAIIFGRSAKARTQNKKPEFLFNLSEDTPPNSYVLIRLDVNKKTGNREAVLGSTSIVTGASSGFSDKQLLKFSAKETEPGKYALKLEKELTAGEYVFCPANGTLALGFDFGVD